MADTLLIDGTEFPPDGTLEFPYEWAYQGNAPAGDGVTYIGMDGGEVGDATYPPTVVPVLVALHAPAEDCWTDPQDELAMAQANQRWRAMLAACRPGYDVILTRRMTMPPLVDGDPLLTEDHTARARYIQSPLARPFVDLNRAVVEFLNLDGLWYGEEVTDDAPGTLTVAGDVRTHRMTITLHGTDVVLTNVTTGSVLSYAGSTGTGVTIEVETARMVTGSVANVGWNQRLPFRLTPGENILTCSAGDTADITYQPAYL